MAVTVTLPDGKALELGDGATGADAAAAIGPGLARAALAVEIDAPDPSSANGAPYLRPAHPAELCDLARPLPDGARIAIVTDRSGEQALALIRHDAAHVLAAAVMELWTGVKISIGPAIENGFY
jgi:threonyl-tRNA synthetase